MGSSRSAFSYAGSSTTSSNLYYGATGSTGYDAVRHSDLASDTNMIIRFDYMTT